MPRPFHGGVIKFIDSLENFKLYEVTMTWDIGSLAPIVRNIIPFQLPSEKRWPGHKLGLCEHVAHSYNLHVPHNFFRRGFNILINFRMHECTLRWVYLVLILQNASTVLLHLTEYIPSVVDRSHASYSNYGNSRLLALH